MNDPDINELEALSSLIESDGWKLFLAHVEQSHGAAAQLQQMDAALAHVGRGDREAAEETVTQIRSRAKAAQALIAWPKERHAQLKAKKEKAERPGLFPGRRRT